mgnify:CR=1 FL=1
MQYCLHISVFFLWCFEFTPIIPQKSSILLSILIQSSRLQFISDWWILTYILCYIIAKIFPCFPECREGSALGQDQETIPFHWMLSLHLLCLYFSVFLSFSGVLPDKRFSFLDEIQRYCLSLSENTWECGMNSWKLGMFVGSRWGWAVRPWRCRRETHSDHYKHTAGLWHLFYNLRCRSYNCTIRFKKHSVQLGLVSDIFLDGLCSSSLIFHLSSIYLLSGFLCSIQHALYLTQLIGSQGWLWSFGSWKLERSLCTSFYTGSSRSSNQADCMRRQPLPRHYGGGRS